MRKVARKPPSDKGRADDFARPPMRHEARPRRRDGGSPSGGGGRSRPEAGRPPRSPPCEGARRTSARPDTGWTCDLDEPSSSTGAPRGDGRAAAVAFDGAGWGGRIRTCEWRNQNPLPYHLATPQRCGPLGTRLTGTGVPISASREAGNRVTEPVPKTPVTAQGSASTARGEPARIGAARPRHRRPRHHPGSRRRCAVARGGVAAERGGETRVRPGRLHRTPVAEFRASPRSCDRRRRIRPRRGAITGKTHLRGRGVVAIQRLAVTECSAVW